MNESQHPFLGSNGGETCKACGLDRRHDIHQQPSKPTAAEDATYTALKAMKDKIVAMEKKEHDLAILNAQSETIAFLEAGVRGKPGVYPNWVYEAHHAIRHQNDNLPWLPDLLAALEWQGGSIHDALNAVRRLVAAEKERAKP